MRFQVALLAAGERTVRDRRVLAAGEQCDIVQGCMPASETQDFSLVRGDHPLPPPGTQQGSSLKPFKDWS